MRPRLSSRSWRRSALVLGTSTDATRCPVAIRLACTAADDHPPARRAGRRAAADRRRRLLYLTLRLRTGPKNRAHGSPAAPRLSLGCSPRSARVDPEGDISPRTPTGFKSSAGPQWCWCRRSTVFVVVPAPTPVMADYSAPASLLRTGPSARCRSSASLMARLGVNQRCALMHWSALRSPAMAHRVQAPLVLQYCSAWSSRPAATQPPGHRLRPVQWRGSLASPPSAAVHPHPGSSRMSSRCRAGQADQTPFDIADLAERSGQCAGYQVTSTHGIRFLVYFVAEFIHAVSRRHRLPPLFLWQLAAGVVETSPAPCVIPARSARVDQGRVLVGVVFCVQHAFPLPVGMAPAPGGARPLALTPTSLMTTILEGGVLMPNEQAWRCRSHQGPL